MAITDILHICGSLNPSRPAAICLGGDVDDYYQVDAAAVGQLTAVYTSGTWAAWIIPRDITQTGTIMAMGDKDVVEFIELNVEAGKLVARCTDATTAAWVLTTDAIQCPAHKWTHVALVHDGQNPILYVNGVKVAQTMSTATAVTKFIADCAGLDSGRIGAANKAGNNSITQEFGGAIADLRLYGGTTNTGALTAAQIKDLVDGSSIIPTTYLYNHWSFDGVLTDAGTGADPATAVGAMVLSCSACEFDSRFRGAGLVTADYPVIAVDDNGNSAHCWAIKSA
jgi:hypothetical protein